MPICNEFIPGRNLPLNVCARPGCGELKHLHPRRKQDWQLALEPTPSPDMPKGEAPVPQAEIDAFNAAAQHLPPAPKEN
jgi:hypothetical protein